MCVMFMLEGRYVALKSLQYGWSPTLNIIYVADGSCASRIVSKSELYIRIVKYIYPFIYKTAQLKFKRQHTT
jgi:hypothetical protein